jgi:capsular exopolysaccharide synthesis family protein
MSRVFDALQRSGVERTGVEYPDTMSVATHILEVPSRRATAEQGTREPAFPGKTEELPLLEKADDARPSFPSLEVSVTPASRLVFLSEPDTLAAEKFRFLGVRLRQLRQSRPIKKILITSTIPEEGKSLVSANLAGVLGQRKQKVLLLEGDLRRPILAERYGLGELNGLAEWLQGGGTTPGNIYHLAGPGFWLMPAGTPPANPLELLQSGRLSQLLAQLESLFDWIIVDSPPLLPLADTTVLARLTDSALLVVREGITEKASLKRGVEILKKSEWLGVVLNACSDVSHHNYYRRYAAARSGSKT